MGTKQIDAQLEKAVCKLDINSVKNLLAKRGKFSREECRKLTAKIDITDAKLSKVRRTTGAIGFASLIPFAIGGAIVVLAPTNSRNLFSESLGFKIMLGSGLVTLASILCNSYYQNHYKKTCAVISELYKKADYSL
ncbi:MAG: hypothetical protein ACYC2U_08810 [Candidatus Amoebophilus sp.]